ncbi:MAG TPA: class I SAM-dependent methyltransferase [Sphingomicrobium sp.]|nr:class I SAM-dependent methyltransferase [Sphingomicrobium sp.]
MQAFPAAPAPAAKAFDAIAPQFDSKFKPWKSVEAQRRSIRRQLVAAFPAGARIIEIGGGTGEDALWLADQGRVVLMTDASPAMVAVASAKCGEKVETAVAAAEDFGELAARLSDEPLFDGAYSVFAGLNCVSDLTVFGRDIARLMRERAPLMVVMFGTCCLGEMAVECLRGRPRQALRRFRRGDVAARLGGFDFSVRYHRGRDLERMLSPWFKLESRSGIGIFVPPSAAEPWISSHPRLLKILETLDRGASRPFAVLGDHILYRFVRTGA